MHFRTRQIRKRPPVHPLRKIKAAYGRLNASYKVSSHHKSYIAGGILVLIAAIIVFRVMMAAYSWVQDLDLKDIFLAAGSELYQDEHGYTNLVILGDGGSLHDGADLVDTIMVASLDHKDKSVTLLSIPRDFYVNTQYKSRINELYRNHKNLIGDNAAFELFQEVVGKITNLDIHYYLRIDFNAFVESIDALGGIDIDVPVAIEDPYYPNATDDGYEPFYISAGIQHLNGETALKYVRSRKTTSDFDRASRQQQVILAIQENALSRNFLGKSKALKELYGIIKKHLNTNLSLREMLGLAKFAKDLDQNHIVKKVLHDDPGQDGGFLYTPDQEAYNNQFVLIPYGENLNLIHKYAGLIFGKRSAFYNPVSIEVLNATKMPGIAGKTAYQLNRFGFNVVNVENLLDPNGERSFADKTVIRYYKWTTDKDGNVIPDNPTLLEALQELIQAEAIPADPSLAENADITIVLGADYNVFLVD